MPKPELPKAVTPHEAAMAMGSLTLRQVIFTINTILSSYQLSKSRRNGNGYSFLIKTINSLDEAELSLIASLLSNAGWINVKAKNSGSRHTPGYFIAVSLEFEPEILASVENYERTGMFSTFGKKRD